MRSPAGNKNPASEIWPDDASGIAVDTVPAGGGREGLFPSGGRRAAGRPTDRQTAGSCGLQLVGRQLPKKRRLLGVERMAEMKTNDRVAGRVRSSLNSEDHSHARPYSYSYPMRVLAEFGAN